MKINQQKYRFLCWFEDTPEERWPMYAGTLEGISEIRQGILERSSPKIIFGPIEIARWEPVKGKRERGQKEDKLCS